MSAGGRKTKYPYSPQKESDQSMRFWEVPGACLGIVAQSSVRLLFLSVLLYGGYLVISKVLEFTGNGGLPGAIELPHSLESLQELGSTLGSTKVPFPEEINRYLCNLSREIIKCR